MILADTSVWIDHLRNRDPILERLLMDGRVLSHPFVIGELALGNLRQREVVLTALADLPRATPADDREVLSFIGRHALHGLGIGYIDTHLLAATRLTSDAKLWTRDKRLRSVAERLGCVAADLDRN